MRCEFIFSNFIFLILTTFFVTQISPHQIARINIRVDIWRRKLFSILRFDFQAKRIDVQKRLMDGYSYQCKNCSLWMGNDAWSSGEETKRSCIFRIFDKKQFLMKTTLRRHTMVICWLLFVGNCDDYQRGGEAWNVTDFVTKKIK